MRSLNKRDTMFLRSMDVAAGDRFNPILLVPMED